MFLKKIEEVFSHMIKGKRVIIVFSSDDTTVLLTFLSSSNEEDKKIKDWIYSNSYEENRIEIEEVFDI